MIYKVWLECKATYDSLVEIEADSPEEAINKALLQADGISMCEVVGEWSCDDVVVTAYMDE